MSDPHGHAKPENEPQTPMWLPALGAALFIAVALWLAVGSGSHVAEAESTGSAADVHK
jgi:hypothetical protein